MRLVAPLLDDLPMRAAYLAKGAAEGLAKGFATGVVAAMTFASPGHEACCFEPSARKPPRSDLNEDRPETPDDCSRSNLTKLRSVT